MSRIRSAGRSPAPSRFLTAAGTPLRLLIPLAALLFLLNALLNAPLFMAGEMPFRGSIESGYLSTARFFFSHPNPWGWDPLIYCGMPAQFVYLPGIPYLAAALMHLFPASDPQTVYRLLVATLACLGPVTVFLFAAYFTPSRTWAFLAALAYTVFSPAYGLLPHLLKDLGSVLLPWRIQILSKYGEVPHIMGLTLLPVALIAVWMAGTRRRFPFIFLAAALLAAVVLTNWIAGLSLAFCCLFLLLAAWRSAKASFLHVAAAGLLGYLLACFWLTPSFIRTVVFNWPVDSFGYQVHRSQQYLILGLIAGVLLIRLLFLRYPGHWYLCFVTLACFTFGWIAVVFSEFGIDTIPESRRYAPEFELFLILALAEWIRHGWRHRNSTVRLCAIGPGVLMLLMGAGQAWTFATQGWTKWKPVPKEQTIEYRAARWISRQRLTGRVMASGGFRYRLGAWFDIPQVGGAWESGLQNREPFNLAYHIRTIDNPEGVIAQLKAMAVQYVIVAGPHSREYYHDIKYPADFAALPAVWHEEDDTIYELPPTSLAHVVYRQELPISFVAAAVAPLARATDDPSRPRLTVSWLDANTLRITGAVPPGALVYVHETWHPGWRATQDGRPIGIEKDGLNFLVLDAAPAPQSSIELHFVGTPGPRVAAALSGLAWVLALAALFRKRDRRKEPAVGSGSATSCT